MLLGHSYQFCFLIHNKSWLILAHFLFSDKIVPWPFSDLLDVCPKLIPFLCLFVVSGCVLLHALNSWYHVADLMISKEANCLAQNTRSKGSSCRFDVASFLWGREMFSTCDFASVPPVSWMKGAVGHSSKLTLTTIMAATVRHQSAVAVRGVVQWRMMGNGTCGRLCLQPCLPVCCDWGEE